MDDPLLDSLRQTLLPYSGGSLLVALSGGRDSVVLLDAIVSFRSELQLTIYAAHFNHRLREAAEGDAEFSRAFASSLGVSCLIGVADSAPDKENTEQWARRERYRFLESARLQCGAKWVLTAHHQRDQVETLLFRMATGRWSGWGIAAADQERKLLRPLLSVSAPQIVNYAERRELRFVTDETNITSMRGVIRTDVLPVFSKISATAERNLALAASDLADDEEFLRDEATRYLDQLFSSDSGVLAALPRPLLRRVLRIGVQELGCGGISRVQLDELTAALGANRLAELSLSAKTNLRYTPSRGLELVCSEDDPLESLPLQIPGEGCFGAGLIIHTELSSGQAADLESLPRTCGEWEVYFDRDTFQQPVVRSAYPGENMRVFRRGSRDVRKLFQEHGIPPEKRGAYPVVAVEGAIVWIPGIARGEFAEITPETREIVKISSRFRV